MSTVPDIDIDVGIGLYATAFQGLGSGYGIRATVDDFAVHEILSQKTLDSLANSNDYFNNAGKYDIARRGVSDVASVDTYSSKGGYAVYMLKKRGIDTAHVLSTIYKMTGARLKSLGLKDASASTSQYVCSTGMNKRLQDIATPKFSITFVGYLKKPLTKKQMLGNRFHIRITGDWSKIDDSSICDPARFTEYTRIPNFYGYQRFGSRRPVTHLVGRAVIKCDFDEAVRLILEFDSKYDTDDRRNMRENLADPAKYGQSMRRLPAGMDTERLILGELDAHGDSFKAFRAIPLQLRRLYISAYQSYIFNRVLSIAISKNEDVLVPIRGDVCFDRAGQLGKYDKNQKGLTTTTTNNSSINDSNHNTNNEHNLIRISPYSVTIPIVGYSYYAKTRFAPFVSSVLADECVSPKDFFVKEMQEVSGEGGFRDSIMQCSQYEWRHNSKTVVFSLARGSFATMLLREIIKSPDPIASGF